MGLGGEGTHVRGRAHGRFRELWVVIGSTVWAAFWGRGEPPIWWSSGGQVGLQRPAATLALCGKIAWNLAFGGAIMAEVVLVAAHIQLAATDLSQYFTSIAIEATADTPESTNFGSGGWREYEGGLRAWSVTADFNQDFAAGALDAILWPLYTAGAKFAFEGRGLAGARSATNPARTGMALITNYPILGGAVGELAVGSLSLQGSGVLTRATT